MPGPSLEALTLEVTETEGAVDSAIVFMGGLAQMLRDAAGDPAAINALAARLEAKQQAIAAAIVANDPNIPPA